MSSIGNVMEILKTGKGKLFAALFALAIIFTFTGIAYGTSAVSVLNSDEPTVQSEEAPATMVAAESEQPEEPVVPDPSDDGLTPSVPSPEDETGEPEEEPVITGPVVQTNGIVRFDLNAYHGSIQCGEDIDVAMVEVDPTTITAATPFTFTVNPAKGYEIKSVSLVSTFNERAIPVEVEEGAEVPEKAVLVSDLTPKMITALEDTKEITIPSDEMEGKPVGSTNSMTYEIGEMAIFAGRDVVITIETEEIQYDSWYKIVQALAEGDDIKLSDDVKTETDVDEPEATEEEIELKNKLNRETAVVKAGTTPTLDLNGFKIESTFTNKPLFKVEGEGTALTIKDDASAPIYGGTGTKGASAADAGREAKWENGTLTYHVTSSVASPNTPYQTSETCLVQTVSAPQGSGAIAGVGSNLIESTTGSLVNITGGILSNAGIVINSNKAKLDMTGGFIVGSSVSAENGAGINAANSDVHIGGHAVIAGNTASVSGKAGGNGGGIALFGTGGNTCAATIDGHAIIAGNKANGAENPGSFNRPTNGLGGGVYAFAAGGSDVIVNVTDNAVVSGNTAKCDGGGFYMDQGTLTVSGAAYVTNNRTEFCPQQESEGLKDPVTMGGAGIFSLKNVNIQGNAKITGNRSADGGGGLLMPKKNNQQNAFFKMDSGYFAANLAEASEGGAMHLTTRDGSYIYSGYITNNETKTKYDYGGGGIFIVSKGREEGSNPGSLKLWNSLVTENNAYGSGGGVASCQNGIVISSDAAIFGNDAEGNSAPADHPIGGQWPSELGLNNAENFVDGKYLASDVYGAKNSTIYNDMLSTDGNTGSYNWKGFMSGNSKYLLKVDKSNNKMIFYEGSLTPEKTLSWEQIYTWDAYGAKKLYLGPTEGEPGIAGLYISTASLKSTLGNDYMTKLEELLDVPMYILDTSTSQCYLVNGLATIVKPDDYQIKDWGNFVNVRVDLYDQTGTWIPSSTKNGGYLYNADGTINTTNLEFINQINATNTSFNGTFSIFKITEFPKNEVIDGVFKASYAEATRMMGLTAYPNSEDKANAIAAARVYVSGNTSSANGGGIAVNGIITIGRDPKKDEPDPNHSTPEKFGSLSISKQFTEALADAPSGKATVLFKVSGYLGKEFYDNLGTRADPYYSNVLGVEYEKSSDGSIIINPIILENLPVDSFFVIEEILDTGFNTSFSGISFEGSNIEQLGDKTVGVRIVANGKDADGNGIIVNTVTFTDIYDPDKPYNDSVVNKWHKNMTPSQGSEE